MQSLHPLWARIVAFFHPYMRTGISGVGYAILCAILMLALAGQQLGVIHTADLIGQRTSNPGPSASTPAPTPIGPFPYYPPSGPTHPAPPITKPSARVPHAANAHAIVIGLRTNDTHVDISGAINAAAARYGFSAPGYAALMGTESGINQYAPHYPIAGAGPCDYSGGLTQITVCTAAGLGIGDGTMSAANINYVFWYEQADANRDVAFSARLVNEFHRAVCWDWYELYASWNLGPGYGCFASIYEYPTNWITQQAIANFNNWSAWVYANHVRWVTTNPPPPTPRPRYGFPLGHYEHWRRAHHLPDISPYWHHYLSAAASAWWTVQDRHGQEICGGILRHERWYPRRRYMKTAYRHCLIFSWPTHHGWSPKVVKR